LQTTLALSIITIHVHQGGGGCSDSCCYHLVSPEEVGHDEILRNQLIFWPHGKMATSSSQRSSLDSLNSASNYTIWDTGDCDDIKVHYVPRQFRPRPDDPSCSDKDDVVSVTAVGESFMYVIPNFDVFAIELRPVEINGYSMRRRATLTYDLFIRNHTSLDREYPSKLTIKDVTVIEVKK